MGFGQWGWDGGVGTVGGGTDRLHLLKPHSQRRGHNSILALCERSGGPVQTIQAIVPLMRKWMPGKKTETEQSCKSWRGKKNQQHKELLSLLKEDKTEEKGRTKIGRADRSALFSRGAISQEEKRVNKLPLEFSLCGGEGEKKNKPNKT